MCSGFQGGRQGDRGTCSANPPAAVIVVGVADPA